MDSYTRGTLASHIQQLAQRLADNTHNISLLEDAGDCYRDIQNLIERIEHCINRPTPPRYCGNCPTPLDNNKPCAQPLYAKPTETHTTCWHCKTTHNVEQLIQNTLKGAPLLFTAPDIQTIMRKIGEPIPDRTWRHWRATGRIKAAGELYGEPAYRLDDARRLRNKTPQTTSM